VPAKGREDHLGQRLRAERRLIQQREDALLARPWSILEPSRP
jgi:hypothetical protein